MGKRSSLRDKATSIPTEVLLSMCAVITTFLAGLDDSLRWMWLVFTAIFIATVTVCRGLRQPQPLDYSELATEHVNFVEGIASALVGIVGTPTKADRERGMGRLLGMLLDTAKGCGQTPTLNRATFFELHDESSGLKLITKEQRGRGHRLSGDLKYSEGDWSRYVIDYIRSPNAWTRRFDDVKKHPPESMPDNANRSYRSMVWAPVRAKEAPVGLLRVDSPKANTFRESDEELLSSVATAIGTGISCIWCTVDAPKAET